MFDRTSDHVLPIGRNSEEFEKSVVLKYFWDRLLSSSSRREKLLSTKKLSSEIPLSSHMISFLNSAIRIRLSFNGFYIIIDSLCGDLVLIAASAGLAGVTQG